MEVRIRQGGYEGKVLRTLGNGTFVRIKKSYDRNAEPAFKILTKRINLYLCKV